MSLHQSNPVISKFTRIIMRDGKKHSAVRIIDDCLILLRNKFNVSDPPAFLEAGIETAKPIVETRKYKIAGRALQVPIPCRPHRQQSLASRFIRDAFRERKERGSALRLANELVDLSKHSGGAYRKREDMHRRAELNKAFAHFVKS